MTYINNQARFRQQLLFDNFKGVSNNTNIYPSDIDSVIELNDELLILIEVKYGNKDIPIGQRLMLERIANCWNGSMNKKGNIRKAYIIKACHNLPSTEDVQLSETIPQATYMDGEWCTLKKEITTYNLIQYIIKM